MFMGFKDWFMEDKSRETYSVKVTCTNCNRVTVVKIPQGKTIEEWSKHTKCGDCNTKDSWVKMN